MKDLNASKEATIIDMRRVSIFGAFAHAPDANTALPA